MRIEVLQNGEVFQTKEVGEGNYKIGRSSECDIQLKSGNISKQHALLVVKGNKAAIVDLGSANGVFVNGILVRKQRIEPDDDVKIGDFQLRVAARVAPKAPPPPRRQAASGGVDGNLAQSLDFGVPAAAAVAEPAPTLSPQERFLQVMDQKVLAPFYSMLKAFDWRWVLACILIGALLLSVLLSVIPIVRWGRGITTKEALARAHTIVNQVVRENYRILSKTNDVTRLTVEAAEAEKGVLEAKIIDPKTETILAPAKYFNKQVTDVYSKIAIQRATSGKEESAEVAAEDDVWVVAHPISIYSPDTNENVVAGIAMVTFQITNEINSTFQPLVEAALFATLFSLAAFFLIYKMVTHPLTEMQGQLDSALKGESVAITAEAKLEELEQLATVINFALARAKQGGGGGAGAIQTDDTDAEDADFIKAVQLFDKGSSDALLLLDKDKKVRFVGKALEEMLSMRNQYAQGQNISEACKDPGFAGTSIDMAERVIGSLGGEEQNMLDINGVARNMTAVGWKNKGGDIRFILLTVKLTSVT